MALLEVDAVTAGYVEGIDILSNLRLRVEPKTITGVIGPNGAGKSTLLKAISGFLPPRGGRITFAGREIQALAPHAIKRLGLSYVPQGTNIFPQLTVEENLQLGTWVFRRDASRVARMVERAYGEFPRLGEKRRMRATALSGGEAKMLSVAKEQVSGPTLAAGRRAVCGPRPSSSPSKSTPASSRPGRRGSRSSLSIRTSRRPSRSPTTSICSRWVRSAARDPVRPSPTSSARSSAMPSSGPEPALLQGQVAEGRQVAHGDAQGPASRPR